MRDIKFRFWSKHLEKFVIPTDAIFIGALKDPSMVTVQYTGLKDKNGVEIYEGYVVSVHSSVWDNDVKNQVRIVKDIREDWAWLNSSVLEFEVIGNIYENPELLDTMAGGNRG